MLLIAFAANAQKNVKFTINHLSGTMPLSTSNMVVNNLDDELKITRLEYYISEITIVHDGGKETAVEDFYMLANATSNDTLSLGSHDITNVEAINFCVGVDPKVNNNDPAAWPSTHPLSPKSPSMHWGWSSGYRFVALEGKSGSSLNQDFQIHALGNKNYFKQSIPTSATDLNGELLIALNANYAEAVNDISMSNGLIEHSERREAASCLRNFQTRVFTSTSGEGNTLSLAPIELNNAITISPMPSTGEITISTNDARFTNGTMILRDALGREILNTKMSSSFIIEEKGLYFLTTIGEGVISTQKIIIQ